MAFDLSQLKRNMFRAVIQVLLDDVMEDMREAKNSLAYYCMEKQEAEEHVKTIKDGEYIERYLKSLLEEDKRLEEKEKSDDFISAMDPDWNRGTK